MSAFDKFLENGFRYERTHQIILYTLLKDTCFAKYLFPQNILETECIGENREVKFEPEKGLFDLLYKANDTILYIELKMWGKLSDGQLEKQVEFLKKNNNRGIYILLGSSWFEHTQESIYSKLNTNAMKIGYESLISALDAFLSDPPSDDDIRGIAQSYKSSLEREFKWLLDTHIAKVDTWLYYYQIYRTIQMKLENIETSIYTVTNPKGPVYIFNNKAWLEQVNINGHTYYVYYELVNGKLCIKFHSPAPAQDKRVIRDTLRDVVHTVFGNDYTFIDSGRLGEYMTICELEHEFLAYPEENLDESVRIFTDIHNRFSQIASMIISKEYQHP